MFPLTLVADYARWETGGPTSRDTCRLAEPFSLKDVAAAMHETFPRKHPMSSSLGNDPGEEARHHLDAVGLAKMRSRLKPIRQTRGVIAGGESERYVASP